MSASITRLNLTKRLARWSGKMLPSKITSTTSADTAQVEDLVAFIDQAWVDIQLSQHTRWSWMRNRLDDDSVSLTADNRILAMSAIDSTCRTVLPFVAQDVVPVRYILLKHPTTDAVHRCLFSNYEAFRGYRDRGSRPTAKPTRFTIRKNGDLEFDPIPDVAYKINLDWVAVPAEFSADADVADMPNHFHMLIVWYAMLHLMDFDENGGRYKMADRQYRKMYNRLLIEQLAEDRHDSYLATSEVYGF